MTLFQLILLILAGVIFFIFFKKLYSGNYPKRGIDYEAKLPDNNIGSISNPKKIFSKVQPERSRIEELIFIADESIVKKDYKEAMNALRSGYIIDSKNTEILKRLGFISMEQENYSDAKMYYEKVLSIDENSSEAKEAIEKLSKKEIQ